MDLNKHIVTNDTSKPFHSNGFAEAANGNHFGATTSISYEQRRQIDSNRQVVANYQRSAIGNTYGILRARPAARQVVITRSEPRKPMPPHFDPYR
ncbi:MAG TPA: hypothetical protein VMR16_03800 [Candidatus Saccharimonadales bacterium]|nr:hypothetical protein [Candidatus Saccharimonadales bacterium]